MINKLLKTLVYFLVPLAFFPHLFFLPACLPLSVPERKMDTQIETDWHPILNTENECLIRLNPRIDGKPKPDLGSLPAVFLGGLSASRDLCRAGLNPQLASFELGWVSTINQGSPFKALQSLSSVAVYTSIN